MRDPLKLFLNPWVILGAIAIGILLTVAVVNILAFSPAPTAGEAAPSPVIIVIEASTETPTPPLLPSATAAPVETVPPAPEPGTLGIGAVIQITGTEGEGLNLRDGPGTDNLVLYLGLESEVFEIQDGPEERDGFTWWYLVGFYDDDRSGWAVSNYLEVIQNP